MAPGRIRTVSILVVVDSAPQLSSDRMRTPDFFEFHSFFSWFPPLHSSDFRFVALRIGFQSLLSWIRLLNGELCRRGRRVPGVSILVVVDSAPQRGTVGTIGNDAHC